MDKRLNGEKSLVESVLELIDLFAMYVRQQLKRTVDESIAAPIKVAGRAAAILILAFTLFALAAIFVAVGLFLLLASLVGYIASYLIIGVLLIIAGIVPLILIGRKKQ